MNEEERKLLRENLEVSKETNELIKKIISAQRWGRALHIIYWLIIIGLSAGTYYFIQPILGTVLGNYDSIINSIDKIQKSTQSLPDSSSINSILNGLRKKQ